MSACFMEAAQGKARREKLCSQDEALEGPQPIYALTTVKATQRFTNRAAWAKRRDRSTSWSFRTVSFIWMEMLRSRKFLPKLPLHGDRSIAMLGKMEAQRMRHGNAGDRSVIHC